MQNFVSQTFIPINRSAKIFGLSLFAMIICTVIVDELILSNYIIPNNVDQLELDINQDSSKLLFASLFYTLILIFDSIIAISAYHIFKSTNRQLALATSLLRIIYVAIAGIGVVFFAVDVIDVHSYHSIKLLGYAFFTLHIFCMGYIVFLSKYIPCFFPAMLFIASFCYVPAFYFPDHFSDPILGIFALFMALGEVSLGIWLLKNDNNLTTSISEYNISNAQS